MNNQFNRIRFVFLSSLSLTSRTSLKSYIISIFKRERIKLESLTIVFCSDEYLLDLNKRFLGHDYYTDILSFPLSAPNLPLEAEIYISVDRVKDNSKVHGVSFKQELLRVIFHGILHFCGYKDKTNTDILKMRTKEDEHISGFKTFISRQA